MFGRKRAKAAAALQARVVHQPVKVKKKAELSPAEETTKRANSRREQKKSTPAV
jgi:hypothetical protein